MINSVKQTASLRFAHFHFVVLILLMAAGAWLRVSNIGVPSIWVDEANTYFSAESVLKTGQPLMPTGKIYGRAPMYTHTVAMFYRLFGVSLVGARLAAAFYGLLAILLAYWVARRLFGPDVALMTAFLMAFSHFEIGWSRVARMYTLLQCFSLTAAYAFIRAVEKPRDRFRSRFTLTMWIWLGVSVAVILTAYLVVHQLALFILPAFLVCLIVRAVVHLFTQRGRERYLNLDSVLAVLGLIAGSLAWVFMPSIQAAAHGFFGYTPPWATQGGMAESRRILLDFLISHVRFPLAALFCIGVAQIGLRKRWEGVLPVCLIGTPLALLSLVFTHRVPRYLFDVYPFFLMIAAYGFVNLIRTELHYLKSHEATARWRKLVLPAFFMILFMSPWFRIGLKIHTFEDGQPNMAVAFNEWREAMAWARANSDSGSVIIASLPEAALFYDLPADYGLNFANYAFSQSIDFRDEAGAFVDIVVGRPFIRTSDHLKQVVDSRSRGCILITAHHFKTPNYLPPELREYLVTALDPPYMTQNGTVLVFSWNRLAEAKE